MIRKSTLLFTILAVLLGIQTPAVCADNTAESKKEETIDNIEKGNQMMIAFMERIKIGDLEGARKIANDMISPAEKIKDTATTEYKCFYSQTEKEYYLLKNKGNTQKVEWVQEPIADGYYLLAVLDFQEKLYKDSLEHISNCIFWNPVRAPFYCERGFLYLYAGEEKDLVNAQVAYEKAIELANNAEDMGAALRGVANVMIAKGDIPVAVAAIVVSKEYDSEHPDSSEQLLHIKRNYPNIDSDIGIREAKKTLKENNIQYEYSHSHVEVLLKMASELKMPEEKEKAIVLLEQARILEPKNVELLNKLKAIQK